MNFRAVPNTDYVDASPNTRLQVATTNATTTGMTFDGAAVSASNTMVLRDNSSAVYTALVVGRQTGGALGSAGDTVTYVVIWTATRGSGAGTVAVAGTAVLGSATRTGALTTAAVSIIADTTNGAPGIYVNGEASKNISWTATVWRTDSP